MMGFDDIFIGFIVSYLAGSLPSLKDIFSRKDEKSLPELLEESYEKALERWCQNDIVREHIAQQEYATIGQLQNAEWEKNLASLKDIIELWAEELKKNDDSRRLIEEQEHQEISDKQDRLTDLLLKQSDREQRKTIRRGLTKHNAVDGYIRRYCSSDKTGNDFLYYLLDKKERKTLTDYVIGCGDEKGNKWILYGSAQTGKTTELKQMCWELQQSGLYLPVCFEVRLNTLLKRDDMPEFQYSEGKEIVVVIDALDEVNGQKYDDLLEEIGGYAYDHPDMKVVLSCRSNYRRESQLNQFMELYLQELRWEDVKEHVLNVVGKGIGHALLRQIGENGLGDFAKTPFFLNVMIDAYKENNKQLPRTKGEIYRLFIEKSYRKEADEKRVRKQMHSFDESLEWLERIALALSLMNAQSISRNELRHCLHDNDENVEECLRYDLIRNEDGRYSFVHNAFREWLAANCLKKKGLAKAKELATHPNGRIKPEWYNIIMLWVSMYGQDQRAEIAGILNWLKGASMELVIYIDRDMLDESTRSEVMKGVILEYKALGIRMSHIMSNDYKDLLEFGQSEETVRFVTDEIRQSTTGTAYYADLMCLCYFMKWELLEAQNKMLAEDLFEAVLDKTKEALASVKGGDLSFLYFDNKYFAQSPRFEKIFAVVGQSNHYEAVRSMTRLIGEADRVDEYIDYILEKERNVHNQHEGHSTQIVTRTSVYHTLAKVKTKESVKKMLSHKFASGLHSYSDEQDAENEMWKNALGLASRYVKEGDMELEAQIEDYYLQTCNNHHFHFEKNEQLRKFMKMMRMWYAESGLREQGRKMFYEKVETIFSPQADGTTKHSDVEKVFWMAALWMTKDDVEADFEKMKTEDGYDRSKAGWYMEIPVEEVSNCASKLYKEKYPEPQGVTKARERRQKSFEDFANYEAFRQMVLEMVSGVEEHTTRKAHFRQLREQDGYSLYAYRFMVSYTDNNDCYDREAIVRDIKNREAYEAFFMREVMDMQRYQSQDLVLTDDTIRRSVDTAKKTVEKLSRGEHPIYCAEAALKMMLNGHFDVAPEELAGLVDYGALSVSKKEPDSYYSKDYSLFDHIAENVDVEVLAPLLIERLKKNVDEEHYRLSYVFLDYLLENRVEDSYELALRYALSGFSHSGYVMEMLIKGRIKIDEIRTAIKEMNDSEKVHVYWTLVREGVAESWVKQSLEAEFRSFNGYDMKRAIQLLLSIGSLDALDYLHLHAELISDESNYNFNYNQVNAVASLCYFIAYCDEHKMESHFFLNSILTSLERIAVSDKDALEEVKRYLMKLTQRGIQFKYLNRYIMSFEDKYYAAYNGIADIRDAMRIVDMERDNDYQEVKDGTDDHDDDNDCIYISYSWKSESMHTVDYLCFVLETNEIPYKLDRRDCGYLDNIKNFMDAIRKGRTVIVVFSRPYMMSQSCMYELSGLMEDESYFKRILPVVVDDTIRNSKFYLDLVKYWKDQKDEQETLVAELKKIDVGVAAPEEEKLKELEAVFKLLPSIKKYIDWTDVENLDSMSATRFNTIVRKIKERRERV